MLMLSCHAAFYSLTTLESKTILCLAGKRVVRVLHIISGACILHATLFM